MFRKPFKASLPASLFVLSLMFGFSTNLAWAQIGPERETAQDSCDAAVGPLLCKTDGELTPEVRMAYLNWARDTVMEELRQDNQIVPDDCLQEVWAGDSLRDAIFGAVFPPDPSILQNYANLRSELGPEFMKKYRSLVVAVAVAKRTKGVETRTDLDTIQETSSGATEHYGRDAAGNYQPGFWMDESLQPLKTKKEKTLVADIAAFMKANQVTALELYRDETRREQLSAFLREQNDAPALVAKIKQSFDSVNGSSRQWSFSASGPPGARTNQIR